MIKVTTNLTSHFKSIVWRSPISQRPKCLETRWIKSLKSQINACCKITNHSTGFYIVSFTLDMLVIHTAANVVIKSNQMAKGCGLRRRRARSLLILIFSIPNIKIFWSLPLPLMSSLKPSKGCGLRKRQARRLVCRLTAAAAVDAKRENYSELLNSLFSASWAEVLLTICRDQTVKINRGGVWSADLLLLQLTQKEKTILSV